MSKIVPYLAVFAGIIIALLAVPSALDTLAIAQDFDSFTKAPAIVVSKREQHHQKGPATGVVEYEFTASNGKVYKGDNSLTRFGDSPEKVNALVRREGGKDHIYVYYDPQDPKRSVVHPVSIWMSLALIALPIFLVFGGVQSFIVNKRRWALQQRANQARRR